MKNKIENKIIEEFEKKFIVVIQNQQEQSKAMEEAKLFILKALIQQQKEIIEKIKIIKNANTEDNSISLDERFLKNATYDEVIKEIK